MEYWEFGIFALDFICILTMWSFYWYRKEKKIRRIVGNVCYCTLQRILIDHSEQDYIPNINNSNNIQV